MEEMASLLELDQLPGAIKSNHRLWRRRERRYIKMESDNGKGKRVAGDELEQLISGAFAAEERRWRVVPVSWLIRLPLDRRIAYVADLGHDRYDVRACIVERSERLVRLSVQVRYFAARFLDRFEERTIEIQLPV
ncbi:MAG: hypothetical protein IPH75_04460 [bacterium]|nr:hypothetical protein [bacterium]